jgi:hypothetical protein
MRTRSVAALTEPTSGATTPVIDVPPDLLAPEGSDRV